MSIKIVTSREYSRFIPNACNRPANPAHIRQIADSMKVFGFIETYPVVVRKVGERLAILDGQHRFYAAQQLGHPIHYVVTESDIDAAKLNETQKPWNPRDYAGSFAQQGSVEYQTLINFAERHGLPLTAAATLLTGKQGTAREDLRSGKLTIPSRSAAEFVAAISKAVGDAGAKFARHGLCLRALRLIVDIPVFSMRQMVDRIAAHPSLLKPQVNRDGYVEMFDAVYNYRTRESDRLPIAQMAAELLRQMQREGAMRGIEAKRNGKKAA